MKAICGKMIPCENSSWRFEKFEFESKEFCWHYHSEYEICLTLNSQGSKYIGDHVSHYDRADLVLLGPNLPHSWQAIPNQSNSKINIYVAQIPAQWLHNLIQQGAEFSSLKELFKRSLRGVEFSQSTTLESTDLFEQMIGSSALGRLTLLIKLFEIMVEDRQAKVLSSSAFSFGKKEDLSVDKLNKVINYIYQNYTNPLNAEDLASLVHMSTNHFHRYFKQRTEKTLNQFINQLRIGKACRLLIKSEALISAISGQCGFNNISNFNRMFRLMKGRTPKEYRKCIKAPSSV